MKEFRETMAARKPVTDEVVSHLAGLPELSRLHIHGVKNFTGKGLDQLASLPVLRAISFVGTGFNGDAAQVLAGARKLESLNLENTAVTADGVAALGGLTALRDLKLKGCEKLDDRAIPVLKKLRFLKELNLSKTGVSKETVAELNKAMPTGKIQ